MEQSCYATSLAYIPTDVRPPPPQEASSVSHQSIFLLMSAGLLTFSRGGGGCW